MDLNNIDLNVFSYGFISALIFILFIFIIIFLMEYIRNKIEERRTKTQLYNQIPSLNNPEVIAPKLKLFKPKIKIAFCNKCKIQTQVLNWKTENWETEQGVKKFLKGICSNCGNEISQIVE